MHMTARLPSPTTTWPQRDFEVRDQVRCIDTHGLAQLEVGQLYTIKHILPGGLLVFAEFSRVRAFHPSYFMSVGDQCSHRRAPRRARRT